MENKSVLENTHFEKITDSEGRTSFVESIAQDKDGFIWVGTTLGLLKYDGYHFIQYIKTNDLLNITNLIFSTIYLDNEGTLWAGGQNRIFVKYDRENDELINLNPGAKTSTINVRTLTEDFDGNILMGTDGEGIKIYSKKENTIKNFFHEDSENLKLFSKQHVESILFTKNKMFIGTKFEGLFIYNIENKTITNTAKIWAHSIFRNTKNNIWIGAKEGLYKYNDNNDSFTQYKNENDVNFKSSIRAICEDKNKNLWLGKGGIFRGLTKIGNNGNVEEYESKFEDTLGRFSEHQICCVFVDLSNVLWIGTLGGGIRRIDLERKKFLNYSKLFRDEFKTYDPGFSCIHINGDIISVGQQSNLDIYRFSKKFNRGLQLIDIELVAVDNSYIVNFFENENSIWFINYREIVEYNKNSKSKILYKNPPGIYFFCAILKDSMIIIGSHSGTLIFDTCAKKFIDLNVMYTSLSKFSGIGNSVMCFCLDRNTLWFGTLGDGLFKYDFEDNSLTNYQNSSDEKSISDNQVTAITQDSKGNIWIGTQSAGICKFDIIKSEFIRYSAERLLNGFVTSLLEDNFGYLWVVFSNGICKFDINTESVINFYENKEIKFYNEYKPTDFVKDKDGIMYYAGPDGLTYFNPNEIKDNPYIPNIVITDFQIFNESIKPSSENPFIKKPITSSKEITLSYNESVFSFEFAALIYNNPSKNQYAYMMEGFDKEWVYCGTRRNVTYTNLDPGEYTFRVKGSNNDGIWNEEGTSIKITITPPWWQTWWFKSCGAAMIFLTAGYGYKKRVNKLKKEKSAQEEFSKKLLNSQEEERKKIASVLHDSIAHDVLITKNSSEIGLRSAGENIEVKEILSKISEQSSLTLNELRRIQFNLHPYEVEKLGLTKALRSIVDRVSKSTEIKFTFEEDFIDKTFSEENEIHLYRIIQEAINNIIKHSSATQAAIKINRTDENIIITISDNGKGFSKSSALQKNSMGLSGISERVKLLGGNLEIESDHGTILKINLPLSFF